MTMLPKTLNEILSTTKNFHHDLAHQFEYGAQRNDDERAGMLLEYLAEHESAMAKKISSIQTSAKPNALNTWFYAYTDRHDILNRVLEPSEYTEKSSDDIREDAARIHDKLIDLFEHLHERAESDSPREVLRELTDMEHIEALFASSESGRIEEI